MKCTLREWQARIKPESEILYNCSEFHTCNDNWVPFSIGIGYMFIMYKGKDLTPYQIGTHDNTVLCAVSTATDSRRRRTGKNRASIVQTLSANGIPNVHLPPSVYFQSLPSYKFVISPEGNGVDCHRHYEAIFAGCIPIIEDHPGIREKYRGCPVLYTNDYHEITEEYLQKVYADMLDQTYDFSAVLLSSQTYENEIKMNGNYWGRRLTGHIWYT
jgi:hypothetical protein